MSKCPFEHVEMEIVPLSPKHSSGIALLLKLIYCFVVMAYLASGIHPHHFETFGATVHYSESSCIIVSFVVSGWKMRVCCLLSQTILSSGLIEME